MENIPATIDQATTIRDLLNRSKRQIILALPKHLDADRLLRIAMTSIQSNRRLLECDPKSLIACIMESAQLGLHPDGILGHAYLVPYKIKGIYQAQLQIGYRGFIELARRSGQVLSLYAHGVHEGDQYEVELGLDPKLKHIPAQNDPGGLVAAYAVVKLKDGGYDFEWMWKHQIDKIFRSSKAADDGPWKTHYEEMAKKTVIRRLAKRLPLSPDFVRAVVADEYRDAGVIGEIVDSATSAQEQADGLTQQLKNVTKDQGEKEPKAELGIVRCPQSNKEVTADYCKEKCNQSQKCQPYQELLFEAA